MNDLYLFPYKFDYLVSALNRTEAISVNSDLIFDELERDLVQKKVNESFGDDILYTQVNFSDLKADHFN
jgi:hypothetical protein